MKHSSVAQAELAKLSREILLDGVSVIAVDISKDLVVGFAFNKIQVAEAVGEKSFFEKFRDTQCISREAFALMDFMIYVDGQFNLFDHYGANTAMELTFLGVLEEYQKRGIGLALCEVSLEIAGRLKNGQHLELLNLSLRDKRPQFVCAMFTSNYSYNVGFKAGFESLYTALYDSFEFDGKKYSEKLPLEHKCTLLCAKKL